MEIDPLKCVTPLRVKEPLNEVSITMSPVMDVQPSKTVRSDGVEMVSGVLLVVVVHSRA
jgi:hypothetical protein